MAGDEEETKEAPKPLPGQVEAALARARAAVEADRKRKDGRWLALVPVTIGVVFLALLMPRATTPDAIPLPRADERELSRLAAEEDRIAREAESTRIDTDVLAVGSAYRRLKAAEAREEGDAALVAARTQIDDALAALRPRPGLERDLLALRAVQTRHFLDALRTWERTGETTNELVELGGAFVPRLLDAGWATTTPTRRIVLDDTQRRVAFKLVWNAILDLEKRPAFTLPLDEQRTMYRLYIERPHPSEMQRAALVAQRKSASDPQACARANFEEARQANQWRVEKIRRLGAIDPAYPTAYALGVALYHAGRYDLSADAFSAWLKEHPDGPYTLRARNHLKAAIAAGGT